MWEQILEAAASSGIWTMLFVTLFFIQIKDSKAREEKYQTTIDGLADKLKIVAEIHEDVKSLLNKTKEE